MAYETERPMVTRPENTKVHPSVDEGAFDLSRGKKLKAYVAALHSDTERDKHSQQEWIRRQQYFLRRRFGLEFRNPQFPWPGSSEIVMPLIDMMCDKLKPSFTNLIFNQQRIVTFVAQNPRSAENARNA